VAKLQLTLCDSNASFTICRSLQPTEICAPCPRYRSKPGKSMALTYLIVAGEDSEPQLWIDSDATLIGMGRAAMLTQVQEMLHLKLCLRGDAIKAYWTVWELYDTPGGKVRNPHEGPRMPWFGRRGTGNSEAKPDGLCSVRNHGKKSPCHQPFKVLSSAVSAHWRSPRRS
jgi:hypothetical protein